MFAVAPNALERPRTRVRVYAGSRCTRASRTASRGDRLSVVKRDARPQPKPTASGRRAKATSCSASRALRATVVGESRRVLPSATLLTVSVDAGSRRLAGREAEADGQGRGALIRLEPGRRSDRTRPRRARAAPPATQAVCSSAEVYSVGSTSTSARESSTNGQTVAWLEASDT